MKIRELFGESSQDEFSQDDFHEKAQQNKKKRLQREKQWNDTDPKDNEDQPLPVDRRLADQKKFDEVYKELRKKGFI